MKMIFKLIIVYLFRYKAATEDEIVKAFQVLDIEGNGYLTAEELTKYMTEEGQYSLRTTMF
jgi:Ca2+-binding EF-hand superfamily protein